MSVQIYKSSDVGAPGLDGLAGSLVAVLKACLVDGFGALPAAGWMMALDDLANHRMILRNDSVAGTGRYFNFRDDGNTRLDGSQLVTSIATFHGCESFADIDTTSGNFPNLAGDLNVDYKMDVARGLTIHKSSVADASLRPWMVVADERTCHLFFWAWNTANSAPSSIVADGLAQSIMGGVMLGDFAPINGSPDPHGAAVIGGRGVYTTTNNYNDHYFAMSGVPINNGCFINRSMEGGAGSVGFGKTPMLMRGPLGLGGAINSNQSAYLPYPAPQSGGIIISDIVFWEERDAPEKVNTLTNDNFLARGIMRGMYSVPHTIDPARSDRCGDSFDTFVVDGKTYLLVAPADRGLMYTMAIDITGPW